MININVYNQLCFFVIHKVEPTVIIQHLRTMNPNNDIIVQYHGGNLGIVPFHHFCIRLLYQVCHCNYNVAHLS